MGFYKLSKHFSMFESCIGSKFSKDNCEKSKVKCLIVIKNVIFFKQQSVNLCCRYCYNAKERNSIEKKTLSLEIAKAGVDWYFKKNDNRHIRFYGSGEPTQEFEQLKEITAYAKSHPNGGKKIQLKFK